MRIGIEAQRIFRQKKHGMDFVVLELIRELQKMDQENEYFIFTNDGPDRAVLPAAPNFTIISKAAPYPVWEQWHLPRWAKQYQLDLLHCTSNTAPLRCAVPLVVTIHDIIYLEKHPLWAHGYTWYQRLGNYYRRLVVRRLCKSAQKILTVSHYEAERFIARGLVTPPRLAVVYNGVGAHFRPIEDRDYLRQIAAKYKLPPRFMLFLGNTDPKKNTPATVRAFARFLAESQSDYHLVIGDLDPAVIRALLKEAGLEAYFERIHFTGYIANQELPALINLATVFIYTSLRESFGIPLLEGMRCGTPVLTGQSSSLPEIAGDAAWQVDVRQEAAIVAGLRKLSEDQDLRESLRTKGMKRAAAFSWAQTARETFEHYMQFRKR